MLKLLVVGTILALASANHPISHDMVQSIKNQTSLWIAHTPDTNPLSQYTKSQLYSMVGTIVYEDLDGISEVDVDEATLPDNFDSRQQWANCIHPIRDQSKCGSCWAFGASEVLSDRFCIASKGTIDVVLSPQDLVSCDSTDQGCNGGVLKNVWVYLVNHGVASDSCIPYTSQSGKSGACSKTCADGKEYHKYKCQKGSAVHHLTIAGIKQEIYENGPVEGAFTVYEDFYNYKSGIYHHVSGGVVGGHAIKVLGWGIENNVSYWICANSWGDSWGETGHFRIQMGSSGINNSMYTCKADLNTGFNTFF